MNAIDTLPTACVYGYQMQMDNRPYKPYLEQGIG